MQNLESQWQQIIDLTGNRCFIPNLKHLLTIYLRHEKLHQSEEYQNFIGRVDEEEAWLNEKKQILTSPNYGDNMAAVQGLLKKHDTLEVDLDVHTQRINDLVKQGDEVII